MLLKAKIKPLLIALVAANLLTACTGMTVPLKKQAELVQGPPVTDIFTHFDLALMCLKGQFRNDVAFSVGAILDQTGKDAITNGGSGKFVTQGAGDMVQSALFQAGVTVLNRRDPRIIESEAKLGIRNPKLIKPTDYFITGSINSLDFIPGGGFDMQVSGVGPAYSQTRIIVGLDVSLTDAKTSQVVANVSLQKQIVAQDYALNSGRFVGRTLLNVQIGAGEREATNFALRQMLNLATFELLSQVIPPSSFAECRAKIPAEYGHLKLSRSAISLYKYEQEMAKKKVEINKQSKPENNSTEILTSSLNTNKEVGHTTTKKVIPTDTITQSNSSIGEATSESHLNDITPELIKNSEIDSDVEAQRKKDTIIKYSDILNKNSKLDSKNVSLKLEKKVADTNQVKSIEKDQLVLGNKSLVKPISGSSEKNTKAENEQPSQMAAKKTDQKDASKPAKKPALQQQDIQVVSDQLQQAEQESLKELPLVFLDKKTGNFKFIMNLDELNTSSDLNKSEEKEISTKPAEKKLEVLANSKTVNSKKKKEKMEKAETQHKTLHEATNNQQTENSESTVDLSNQALNVFTEENPQMTEGFWDEATLTDASNDVKNNVALR
jgi:curli biogenesis system outer membrane secretion channel CsgG